MGITIFTYGTFREGRQKEIHIDYFKDMTLLEVLEILDIDSHAPGIVKINDATGLMEDSLGDNIPDGSYIYFMPFLLRIGDMVIDTKHYFRHTKLQKSLAYFLSMWIATTQ